MIMKDHIRYFKLTKRSRSSFSLEQFSFGLSMSVCLSQVYGLMPLPIAINFGINLLGTNAERYILFPSCIKTAAVLWVF